MQASKHRNSNQHISYRLFTVVDGVFFSRSLTFIFHMVMTAHKWSSLKLCRLPNTANSVIIPIISYPTRFVLAQNHVFWRTARPNRPPRLVCACVREQKEIIVTRPYISPTRRGASANPNFPKLGRIGGWPDVITTTNFELDRLAAVGLVWVESLPH